MILLYTFICWFVFSHFVGQLYDAWKSLHMGLIKASMYKQFQGIKKSRDSKVVLSHLFSRYPKTWRSLWSELIHQCESQDLLVDLAERTRLKDYCLASKSKNLQTQVENVTLLCLIGTPEERMMYLNSLPSDSSIWQIPLPTPCFQHHDVAVIYLKRLLTLHHPRKASAILAVLNSEKAKQALLELCCFLDFRSFAVSASVHLETPDQLEFIRESQFHGVDEVQFIKYFSRYSVEGQSMLRSTFSSSAWWYSRYILNAAGKTNSPPHNIAWFYSRRSLEVKARAHSGLPDIHIAA